MATLIKTFFILTALLLADLNTRAQTSTVKKQTGKQFEGLWINKQTTRCLEISFRNGYATIVDWTARLQKRESGDIYKAFLKKGKLIMPEETGHRAPYSEIIIKNNTLIYLSKSMGATPIWNKEVFTKKPGLRYFNHSSL